MMKNDVDHRPLISVIVPVYNTELYLERCIESLVNQTYKEIEIVLVNDGSSDGSLALCKSLQEKYKNIVVIDKKNGGLSSARNAGIKKASGKYITFIDSDDWIDTRTYEDCLKLMNDYDADTIEFNYAKVEELKEVVQPRERIKSFTGKQILQYYMESSTRTGSYSVCRCVFSRNLFGGIFFREGKINEDIDFKYRVLTRCKKLVTTNQIRYYYFQSGNSLSSGGLKTKDFDLYEAADELYNLTKNENYGSIAKLGRVKKARTAFSLLSKIAYYGIADNSIDKKKIVKRLESEHRRNCMTLLSAPIPFSRKILSVLFAIDYRIAEFAIFALRKLQLNH